MKLVLMVLILLGVYSNALMGAPQEISLWRHQASEIEMKAAFEEIARFNESQSRWKIVPDLIPEASYTQSIRVAGQAEVLPCIIEIDQPLGPSFAWSGFIQPLDGLIDDALLASINRSGKGTYKGRVYTVGPLDVSLALFTRKSLIKRIGVRYPTIDQPWNKTEFMAVLDAVKSTGDYQYPFDMRAQDVTEWIPYAWGPFMASWGADLIDRSDYLTVDGVLNSAEAVQFGQWIQHLVEENYMDAHPKNDNGFVNGDIGIQYGGSWALSRYYSIFKDDLAVLPVPDFGHGSIIGGGSWHWAMTETCAHPEAAKAFITFLMTAEEQASITKIMGIFPTNSHAMALTKSYSKDGKWRMLVDFSKRFAKLRPETPAYAEISSSYKKAMSHILNGLPPKLALDLAVDNIQVAFERNQNYASP